MPPAFSTASMATMSSGERSSRIDDNRAPESEVLQIKDLTELVLESLEGNESAETGGPLDGNGETP